MNQVYSNFKKYDSKGRRVAIFGWRYNSGKERMKVTVFTCSLQDKFSKETAKRAWAEYDSIIRDIQAEHMPPKFHGETFTIPDDQYDPQKPLKSFIYWCNETYWFKKVMGTPLVTLPIVGVRKVRDVTPLGVRHGYQIEVLTKYRFSLIKT